MPHRSRPFCINNKSLIATRKVHKVHDDVLYWFFTKSLESSRTIEIGPKTYKYHEWSTKRRSFRCQLRPLDGVRVASAQNRTRHDTHARAPQPLDKLAARTQIHKHRALPPPTGTQHAHSHTRTHTHTHTHRRGIRERCRPALKVSLQGERGGSHTHTHTHTHPTHLILCISHVDGPGPVPVHREAAEPGRRQRVQELGEALRHAPEDVARVPVLRQQERQLQVGLLLKRHLAAVAARQLVSRVLSDFDDAVGERGRED